MSGIEPSRAIGQVASWRLAAEIVRRYPGRFFVIEMHPGGGTYDCIGLISRNENLHPYSIVLNLGGTIAISVDGLGYEGSQSQAARELMATENPVATLDKLCGDAGLPAEGLPPLTREAVAYRVIVAFLTHAIFAKFKWECRNGYDDSSGMSGGGRRDHLFKRFPEALNRLASDEFQSLSGEPSYRFWFLLKDGHPYFAIEPERGLAWDLKGKRTDLYGEYSASRRIWPVVLKMAGSSSCRNIEPLLIEPPILPLALIFRAPSRAGGDTVT